MRLLLATLLFTVFLSCASSPRGTISDRSTFPERYDTPSTSSPGKEADDSTIIASDDSSLPDAVLDPGASSEKSADESTSAVPEKKAPSVTKDKFSDKDLFDSIVAAPLGATPKNYRLYTNNRFNYQLFVPQSWYIHEDTVSDYAITRVSRNNSVMSVKTFKPSRLKRDSYRSKAIREIKLKDPNYKTIIAGEELRLYSGVFATLMVHEYRSKNIRYLSRTLTFIQGENGYIINCEAPIKRFYTDEKAFNTFMTSFRYLRD